VVHSFLEEYYWRGFVFSELKKKWGKFNAVVVSSFAFTLHHVVVINQYVRVEPRIAYNLFGSFCVFCCGLIWAIQYGASKKLRVSWVSHILADLLILGVGYDIVFIP